MTAWLSRAASWASARWYRWPLLVGLAVVAVVGIPVLLARWLGRGSGAVARRIVERRREREREEDQIQQRLEEAVAVHRERVEEARRRRAEAEDALAVDEDALDAAELEGSTALLYDDEGRLL